MLEEKGLGYISIEEDLSNPSPELLALHPEGLVPLLIHQTGNENRTLYQSTVITEYLDEYFPENPLMPRDAGLRAQARLWTYWCDTLFKPNLDQFKYELSNLDQDAADALRDRLHGLLSHWDTALQKNPFLLGATATLADIHLFPFARQFFAIKDGLPGLDKYEALSQWLKLWLARPSFERAMKR